MIKSSFPFNNKDIEFSKPKDNLLLNINKIEACPNCGNTRPVFQHFQNGMLVCFICRKATSNNKNFVSAF